MDGLEIDIWCCRKGGVEGVNENGEHLVDMCMRVVRANMFQHKMTHRYTFRRRNEG